MNTLILLATQNWIGNLAYVIAAGLMTGAASMILYRWFSPQERLKTIQTKLAESQQEMAEYDGEFAGLWQLVKLNLKLASQRVAWSIGPSLIAALPIIGVFVVLDSRHNQLVRQQTHSVAVTLAPVSFDSPGPSATVSKASGQEAATNFSVTRSVDKELARVDYFPLGPAWVRSWISSFVLCSTISAIMVKQLQGVI